MHRVDWTARRLPELITAQARMDIARSVYCNVIVIGGGGGALWGPGGAAGEAKVESGRKLWDIPAARRAPRRRDAFTRRTRKAHEMSDQFAIATLCSAGYVHWLEHLHRNLNLLRLVPLRLTVCVTDRQTRAAARTCVTQG